MKNLFYFLFLICCSLRAEICDLETFSKLIIVRASVNDTNYIKKTNCPAETIRSFGKIINSIEGKITSEHLNRILEEESSLNVIAMIPRQIEVTTLEKVINENLNLDNNLVTKDINFVGTQSILALTEQDQISLECQQCEILGEHNIKINISNPLAASSQSYWARSQILKKITAYKTTEEVSTKTAENFTSNLEATEIAVSKPELYLTDIKDLKFYRLNHSVKKGELIKLSDISPIVLVKTGSRVKVKIENKTLNLTSTSLANKSGVYGDSIELTNINSKRKLIGRITDFNTVVIDL